MMTHEELRRRFEVYYHGNLFIGTACVIIGLVALIISTVVAARTQRGEFVSPVMRWIMCVTWTAFSYLLPVCSLSPNTACERTVCYARIAEKCLWAQPNLKALRA